MLLRPLFPAGSSRITYSCSLDTGGFWEGKRIGVAWSLVASGGGQGWVRGDVLRTDSEEGAGSVAQWINLFLSKYEDQEIRSPKPT